MIESRNKYFPQLISKHLSDKLDYLKTTYGSESKEYLSIANQYIFNESEDAECKIELSSKHYEAGTNADGCSHNVERLYKNHCCVEITFACKSYCRYCLRSNYTRDVINQDEMEEIVRFINERSLEEVLITGGDPFVTPTALINFIKLLLTKAPSIKIVRIATRMITQDPEGISDKIFYLLELLSKKVRVEVATQINSAQEFDEKVDEVIKKIQSYGIVIYSQNVFLKGINDSSEQLIDLYHSMRLRGIEAHYLFHACPIIHTQHLRPTVKKMIECYEDLCNSGAVTGRSKPMCAIMSGIGKITLLPNNVLEMKDGIVKLKSRYKYEDRMKYNPQWVIPSNGFIDEEGYLGINYVDGED